MRIEIINGEECIIGKGEDTVFEICKIIFPNSLVRRQVKIYYLVTAEDFENMDTIHKKHKADIVVSVQQHYRIVFQVQGRDHVGDIKAKKDSLHEKWFKKEQERIPYSRVICNRRGLMALARDDYKLKGGENEL